MTGKLGDKWLVFCQNFPFQLFSVYAFQSISFVHQIVPWFVWQCIASISSSFCSMQHVATHPFGVGYNYITYDIPFICSYILLTLMNLTNFFGLKYTGNVSLHVIRPPLTHKCTFHISSNQKEYMKCEMSAKWIFRKCHFLSCAYMESYQQLPIVGY